MAATSPSDSALAESTSQTSTTLSAAISSSSPAAPSDSVSTSDTSSLSTQVSSIPSPTSSSLLSGSTSSSLSLSTTAPAPSSSSVSPAPSSGHDLSQGAWIGIAVSCGVGGLIIGLLAAMFFLRRRPKTIAGEAPELLKVHSGNKSFDSRPFTASPAIEPAPGVESTVPDLYQFFTIPKSDKDLVGELRSLGHLIQQHVEDHYHASSVTQSASSLSETLTDLGLSSLTMGIPGPEHLASIAVDVKSRHVALQHVISRIIFDSISVQSKGSISLLPPSVSSLAQNMPPCEKQVGSPDAVSLALTRWRQASVFLLNPRRSDRGPLVAEESALKPHTTKLVAAMNKFLGVFVDEQNRDYQEAHLQDIALECAKFGYVIFSQPAEFVWEFEAEVEKEIVVCPGLVKMTDNQGIKCAPVTVVTPEIQQVPV